MGDLVPEDDGRDPSIDSLADAQSHVTSDLAKRIWDAVSPIYQIADQDCWDSGLKDPCDCEPCLAKKALAKIERIVYPVVRSNRPKRLDYAEAVYFERWVKENTRIPGVNGGCGLLELILSDESVTDLHYLKHRPAFITQRDMDVATTVIQWLGTNCGRSFVEDCERECKARDLERRQIGKHWHESAWTEYREKPEFERIADRVVEKGCGSLTDEMKAVMRREVLKAMLYAKSKAEVLSLEMDADGSNV